MKFTGNRFSYRRISAVSAKAMARNVPKIVIETTTSSSE